jgi:uncharacterized surface protein with fasciclin (FAS1) repeats
MTTKIVLGLGVVAVAGTTLAVGISNMASHPSNEGDPVALTATSTASTTATHTEPAYYRASGKGTAAAVIGNIPEARSFNALLKATGVDAILRGKGPYTVFVPNNAAFHAAPSDILEGMTFAEKKRLIENHIIVGKRIDIEALSTGKEMSLSGDTLNFSIAERDRVPRVGGALMYGSYTTDNGVIYLVTQVLIPPEKAIVR